MGITAKGHHGRGQRRLPHIPEVAHHWRERRRQVFAPPEIHRRRLRPRPGRHHRSRFQSQDHSRKPGQDQAGDLGHGGTGAVSHADTELLPGRAGRHSRLRVTSRETFTAIENWLAELETYSTNHDIVKMLVGNKCDLEDRVVSKDDGIKLARKHQMMFIESSAKTREGVQCAFEELVEKVIQTPGLWEMSSDKKKNIQVDGGGGGAGASSCSYC